MNISRMIVDAQERWKLNTGAPSDLNSSGIELLSVRELLQRLIVVQDPLSVEVQNNVAWDSHSNESWR